MKFLKKLFETKEEKEIDKAFDNLENRLEEYRKYIGFRFESFIQDISNKRKMQLTQDKQAKELLLYDDCYIIPKDKLKQFIDNI